MAHKACYDFEFSRANAAKSIVTCLKHVTNARRATRKCQISLSHKPGTVETVRFRARCCWSRAGPVKKCHFHGRCIVLTTNECHSFAKHAWDYKRDRRADCSWARLVNLEVKASGVFLFGLHPKIKTRDVSGGLRGLQTGSESITHAFAWSSPT